VKSNSAYELVDVIDSDGNTIATDGVAGAERWLPREPAQNLEGVSLRLEVAGCERSPGQLPLPTYGYDKQRC
jgi:hypothetical protein